MEQYDAPAAPIRRGVIPIESPSADLRLRTVAATRVEQPIVSRWESGKEMPSLERLFELAGVLEVPVGYFVGEVSVTFTKEDGQQVTVAADDPAKSGKGS